MYDLLRNSPAETKSSANSPGRSVLCYVVAQSVLVPPGDLLAGGSDESRSKAIADSHHQTSDSCLKVNRN